ncbi:hypothetical protein D3C72_1402120 [compost metagenome]
MKAVGNQQAQRRFGHRHAQAQKAQRGLQRDGAGNLQRSDDDQRRQAVGQDVAHHDAPAGNVLAARGFHIFTPALHQRLAASRAGVVGPLQNHQREHHVAHALAKVCQDHHCHQDGGEREDQVDQPHDDGVGSPTGIGGQQAQQRTHDTRDECGAHTHHQADAQAVQNGGIQIAALAVGAQHVAEGVQTVGRARWQAGVEHIELLQVIGVLRRDPGRHERGQNQHHGHHQAKHRQARCHEIGHVLAPWRGLAHGGGSRREVGTAAHAAVSRRTRGSSTL